MPSPSFLINSDCADLLRFGSRRNLLALVWTQSQPKVRWLDNSDHKHRNSTTMSLKRCVIAVIFHVYQPRWDDTNTWGPLIFTGIRHSMWNMVANLTMYPQADFSRSFVNRAQSTTSGLVFHRMISRPLPSPAPPPGKLTPHLSKFLNWHQEKYDFNGDRLWKAPIGKWLEMRPLCMRSRNASNHGP